jgi:hypothetical protein
MNMYATRLLVSSKHNSTALNILWFCVQELHVISGRERFDLYST